MSTFSTARRVGIVLTGAALLASAGQYALAAPLHEQGHHCPQRPSGYIGGRWDKMGGEQSPIGCPTGPEQIPVHKPPGFPADMAERNRIASRYQPFENGQIVWSPAQGSGMTVAVYGYGNKIHVEWGDTTPFYYQKFIVSVDGNQTDINSSGRDGHTERTTTPGTHRVVVEGCDSKCRQGWTVPVEVYVPGERKPPTPAPTPSPVIGVAAHGDGSFKVSGSGFLPRSNIHIRIVVGNDYSNPLWLEQSLGPLRADADGRIAVESGKICHGSNTLNFSANDGRDSKRDLTGTLWSNTVHARCPA
ncbi:LGFP repeat-containing protein [Nocardia goodfellowii]|uniref:Uncharacterized protein n=1 Tax=Nocardia goodfellowii TaxID=882446 RepID=A0ABS4QHN5_9NOCA|nr:hypothetical protein [Nocardia goodfellowii]MBP2191212.1 hypothetical protein [Nocardia goodfellowii]